MSRKRNPGWVVAKAAFGVLVLAWLVRRADLGNLADVWADMHVWPLAGAFAAQAFAKLAWTSRWRDILGAIGIERRFRDLLALVFVGLYFNTFLPTSMGGDVIRGYYTGTEGNRAASYGALIVERALGLVTLAAIAAVAAIIGLVMTPHVLPREILLVFGAVSAALAVCGTIAFAWTAWLGPVRRFAAGRSAKLGSAVEGVAAAIEMFRRPTTPTLRVLIASAGLQLIAVLFHLGCARAVGLTEPAVTYFVIVPIAVIAAMLPFTLNGIGLREGVLVGLLEAAGATVSRASAFALLALAVSTVFALIGAFVYPFYRGPAAEADRVES